jgi:hypothetical protein
MYDNRRPSLLRQAVALVQKFKSRVAVFPALVSSRVFCNEFDAPQSHGFAADSNTLGQQILEGIKTFLMGSDPFNSI